MKTGAVGGEALQWKVAAFDALTVPELHDLLQLRSEVFVVEQNCVFQDVDGADVQAVHVLGTQGGLLVAYARCFPAGVKFAEVSIGRVVTRSQWRGQGLGHLLIQRAVAAANALWGVQAIRIGAQAHLQKYYCGHGFVDAGEAYIEDGIEHLEMVWRP